MPSPFPGMDPWLENPAWFPNLHHLLITATNGQLQPQLPPRGYLVTIGERVWVTEPGRSIYPDVGVVRQSRERSSSGGTAILEADEAIRVKSLAAEAREPYLEILDASGHLVTGIEFVSPTNKSQTQGRKLYLKKQQEVLHSSANLVEIDLLRQGRHLLAVPRHLIDSGWDWDYLVSISRASAVDEYELYPIPLTRRLPRIRIPLKPGDADAVLNLQLALDHAYDEGPFADRLDYNQPPFGRLSVKKAAWCRTILTQKGVIAGG